MKYTAMADPFWGHGATQSLETHGMARGWNWLKAQTGNTHPGAQMPCGWVSACPYSGAYPTGFGKNGNSCEGPAPQLFESLKAWGITHFHPSGTGYIGNFYNYFLCTPSSPQADVSQISDLTGTEAHPGYFKGRLLQYGADFELACTETAALHRYSFHAGHGTVTIDCRAVGLRLPMPNYRESIEEYEITGKEADGCQGHITANGVKIYFALRASGNLSAKGQKDGVITYRFASERAELALGFSLTDMDHAAANLDRAFRRGFDRVRQDAGNAWEDLLGTVEAEFRSEAEKKRFYTTLYHSFPKPGRHDAGYIDFMTMWDIYRTQLPLLLSLSREHARPMLLSMLDTIEQFGYFPIFCFMNAVRDRESNQATALAVYTLCDGFMRNILTPADYPRVKAALQKEFAHADVAGKSPTHILDLAGAYEAARQIAMLCGDNQYAGELREKSAIWQTAYDPATGFLVQNAVYYEGNYRNYSFRPHADMEKRIALAGGKEKFLAMLDDFFAVNYREQKPFAREKRIGYFEAMNNESDMETPYTYLWCGRPDRTAMILDTIRRFQFTDGEGGAPGNVDSGALASWYVWACLGIYPLTGSGYYLLGSPSVTEAKLHLTQGVLHITVQRESAGAVIPQKVEFNGKILHDFRLPVTETERGGELKFYLSTKGL